MPPEERDSVFHELTNLIPKYKFFYVMPEFVLSAQALSCFQLMIEKQSLKQLVVDEAHCVDAWGIDLDQPIKNLLN
jgi:superfamily II DNA helicase RecQ